MTTTTVSDALSGTLHVAGFEDRLSIFEAARLNDVFSIRMRIREYKKEDSPEQINDLNENGMSALHYAARFGHVDCTKLILEAEGCDINVVGAQGAQPIHLAAKFFRDKKKPKGSCSDTVMEDDSSEENVISLLIKNGANANATDAYDLTPLRYAAQKGIMAALNILLQKKLKIDIEKQDRSGTTALHSACLKGHINAIDILMENGASILTTDKKGMNALHYAAIGSKGFEVLQKILLKVKEQKILSKENMTIPQLLNIPDVNDETLLHLAIGADSYDTCQLLISEGAELNKRKLCSGKTPLHLAASKAQDMNIVRLLVESGAKIQLRDDIEETALHKAARNNKVEILEYLLEKGSKVDDLDRDGQTALIEAVAKDNSQILKILLSRGAKIDVLDNSHKSVVFWAAETNAISVLEELLPRMQNMDILGDIIEIKDSLSNSPLHVAAAKGHEEVVSLLIQYGAEVDPRNDQDKTPLHLAVTKGEINVARKLIEKKPSIINDRIGGENTPAHLAAIYGKHEMLQCLLDAGADVSPRDSVGLTPLSRAAMLGDKDCVKVLLQHRASVSIKNLNGRTPLFLACEKGYVEVVKMLIKPGTDMCALDETNLSMLDLAINNGHTEVVEIFLEHDCFFDLMRHSFIVKGIKTTPMREMIVKLPDMAYKVLNKCMSTNDFGMRTENYQVEFNYELIDDKFAPWNNTTHRRRNPRSEDLVNETASVLIRTTMKDVEAHEITEEAIKTKFQQIHPLSVMCKEENGALLGHPLVSSLIELKWAKFGRPVFYSKFALFKAFLILLTIYLLLITPTLAEREINEYKNVTKCIDGNIDATTSHVTNTLQIVIIIMSILQLLFEATQLIDRRLNYFLDPANWLEVSVYILALFYLKNTDHADIRTNCDMADRKRVLGAVSAFLAWVDLLLFMRKFPSSGIYVVMFSDVLKTFVKFSVTFSMFLMAFALGFYSLFKRKTFGNIGKSFVKTIALTIGEFNFDDLFGGDDSEYLPRITWVLFFIFLIVMTILLMNMLVVKMYCDEDYIHQKVIDILSIALLS